MCCSINTLNNNIIGKRDFVLYTPIHLIVYEHYIAFHFFCIAVLACAIAI